MIAGHPNPDALLRTLAHIAATSVQGSRRQELALFAMGVLTRSRYTSDEAERLALDWAHDAWRNPEV